MLMGISFRDQINHSLEISTVQSHRMLSIRTHFHLGFICMLSLILVSLIYPDMRFRTQDIFIIVNALSFSTLCLEGELHTFKLKAWSSPSVIMMTTCSRFTTKVVIVFIVFRNGRYIEAKLRSKAGNWKALFIRVALFSLFRTVCLV